MTQDTVHVVQANANVFFVPTGTIVIADVLASSDGRMYIIQGTYRYWVMFSQSALCEYRTY